MVHTLLMAIQSTFDLAPRSQSVREQTLVPVGLSAGFSMDECYLIGPPPVFIACPLVSSVVNQLIIMSLGRYLKPSADSGGTNSNLELLPDPNAESDESARVVVVAAVNK